MPHRSPLTPRFERPTYSPLSLTQDCIAPLPEHVRDGVEIVVASLPWGRNQRIPHAEYLTDLLANLRSALPAHATFCLISAEPLAAVAAEVRPRTAAAVDARYSLLLAAARCCSLLQHQTHHHHHHP